jgi:hypothetical protein
MRDILHYAAQVNLFAFVGTGCLVGLPSTRLKEYEWATSHLRAKIDFIFMLTVLSFIIAVSLTEA